jgi:hypothetical protein
MRLKSIFRVMVTGLLCAQVPAWSSGMALKVAVTKSTCKDVISKQEAQKGIPQGLLKAIATVESGISPWTVNAMGRAHTFGSKEAAASYVRELLENGVKNISVGCMQLHYPSHRRHFTSVEEMFEPENNIAHAAKLIKNLERRHGSIDQAVKMYHSPSPSHHNPYKKRVYGMWAKFGGIHPNSKNQKSSLLKPVTLKKDEKKSVNMSKPTTRFNFGMTAVSSVKNKDQKA